MGNARRIIEVNESIVGPRTPKLKTVRPRKLTDYPNLPAAYRDAARALASPLRMGPPICDELIDFVQHLFTEEEASVARHIGLYSGTSAVDIAKAEHRPIEPIESILDRLCNEKMCIVSSGDGDNRRYRMLPIVPGIFELVLFTHTPDTLTDWHRRFAELFEALYDTGYSLDYQEHTTPVVRYLPVGKVIDAHPMALPSDKLEAVMDEWSVFAVGNCQCRTAMVVVGQGCGKPLGNCMIMGEWAEQSIKEGRARQVSKKEAIEIKREAEAHGMVNWMMNVRSSKGQNSCSCCGCCCHAMRMISEFNAPGSIAPAHFLPRFDASRCTYCGRCATNCPMAAIAVDTKQKAYRHLRERCIGCGLCVLACERQRALTMEAVPNYKLPYRSWFSLIAHSMPGMLRTSFKLWRQRR
jgi:Pyruvate/2-oxoacid:ferredoxin oxidoreductase delta subunit